MEGQILDGTGALTKLDGRAAARNSIQHQMQLRKLLSSLLD